jgi:hypothetical protein
MGINASQSALLAQIYARLSKNAKNALAGVCILRILRALFGPTEQAEIPSHSPPACSQPFVPAS